MLQKQIPKFHLVAAEKIKQNFSPQTIIKTKEIKVYLGRVFKIPRRMKIEVIKEMVDYDLMKFQNRDLIQII